ncbi:uncharacterized protein LOC121726098 [Aricia agestis]|uniref:uncharacterized protein LOC121726098 n=1 Tax=Aricia agestis TaxID=91739 RepID=UPI001C2067B1|nr:uncharacterized protein LOC121726098 [Aricia agestis]XP_041969274.1 uncharacterized protein LOC121726098 [Aricia agestis]
MDSAKEQSCKQYITKITILLPSKKNFCKEYKKICNEEESVKYIYLGIIRVTEEAIRIGNIDKFKNACKIIEYINSIENVTWLQETYEHENNPFNKSNVIILACKYNKCNILKHIFHSENRILLNLSVDIGRDKFKLTDRDVSGRTAFYYAILGNNVELLNTLCSDWPYTYQSEPAYLQELDDVISDAYSELKLRNVLLSEEIQFYVEYKLIDLRFFHNAGNHSQYRNIRPNLSVVKERIELVIQCNELLQAEYCGEKKVDEMFIYVASFVAQNIDVLKRQIKCTYDRLPWEEIEFCLICFISGQKNYDIINMIYKTVLKKTTILDHLQHFINILDEEKHNIKGADVGSNIPKLKREVVVENIINKNKALTALYTDFEEVRNVYSMTKIITYIELALDSDPQEKMGQLIIERALLITGEYLKNSLESPNLSDSISNILLCSGLQNDTLIILRSIRNLLSHSQSLINRMDTVKNNNSNNIYCIIQNDLKKIKTEINEILVESKSNAVKKILMKILELNDYDEIMELVSIFKNIKISETDLNNNIKCDERETIEKLVKELKSKITNRTFQQEKLLQEISLIIDRGETNVQSSEEIIRFGVLWLKNISKADFHEKEVAGMKVTISNFLEKLTPKIDNEGLTRIIALSRILYNNINVKNKQEQSEKLINKLSCGLKNVSQLSFQILDDPSLKKHDEYEEIKCLIQKISYYANFSLNQVKGLEALKIRYEENKPDYTTIVNNSPEDSLNERLQTLYSVLKFDDFEPYKLIQQFDSFGKNLKVQVATESLVFDVLEISKNYLSNNLLLFDTNCPILIGKCLRNHLAHGNAIVDIFPYSSARSLFGNAIKFIKAKGSSIIRDNLFIGQPIINNPCDIKNRFDHNIDMIKSQDEMFKALKEGNFDKLLELTKAGAEIRGRNFITMSTLHIAACGGNIDIIKFLIANGLDIESKDMDGQSPLFMAVRNGKMDIVKYFIEDKKLSIDNVDNSGRTILHVAALAGHNIIIEYLLGKNANVSVKDRNGYSPVHFAIIRNHTKAAITLLQKESNVDLNEVCGGFTPLHVAAEHGHLDVVNYLIGRNANINAKNDNNWIPLHGAALKGHADVVKVLLLNGSEVYVKSVDGSTPLHYAVENGSETVANVLLESGEKNDDFYENLNSVLPYACYMGNEAIVGLFLKYNVNINKQTKDRRTASHGAAERGHHKILTMLVRQKANINIESSDGATPLKLAIKGNYIEAVKLLLNYGANINCKSGLKQFTSLHVAASIGNEIILEMLIKQGAKINDLNIDGYSALHIATQCGHTKSVQTLIYYGADYDNFANYNFSPIHMAATEGHAEIVDIFLKQNVDVNSTANFQEGKVSPLHCAALTGDLDTVKTLVKSGANIDGIGFGNYTPLNVAIDMGHSEVFKFMLKERNAVHSTSAFASYLHSAVRQGNSEILELLMKNGEKASIEHLFTAILASNTDVVKTILKYQKFDLNAKYENITLLTLAAVSGNKNIIKILLQFGADPNKGDFLYPLYIAAYFNNVEIISVLLKSGAQVNTRCEGGSTPLHIAAIRGNTNVVEILLDNGADAEIKDDKNRTALELAIANKHFLVVKTLFQSLKDIINSKGNDDYSLLHIAAQEGDCDIVRYLIREGANIHAKNLLGSKPIHIAAREGHANLVELFLCEGLSLYDPGASNQTVLHYATLKNKLEVVKFLIGKSFDVNVKDANGRTSIHFAAEFGFKKIVQFLLDNSAVYNAVDNFDCTPADLTKNAHIKRILKFTKSLFESVKQNKYLDVENLIRNGASVKAKNTGDVTTLHYAAWKGYNETVISLLKYNADPNISGKNGYSCLHFAAKFGHVDVVKSLLTNGAVYNAVDHNGKTPLYFAENKSIVHLLNLINDCFKNVENSSSRVIEILKTVKDMGTIKAIMNAQNINKQTLLVVAILKKYPLAEQLKNILQVDVSTQLNKAELLITQEKCQEALYILNDILQKRKEIFGLHSPSTIDIQNRIASALYKQRKFQEAHRIFCETYDIQKAILGENCEDTLDTKSNIGLVLHRLGEDERAVTIYEDVFKKQRDLLGRCHGETLKTQLHMALVLDSIGRHDEALKNNQEVFEMSILGGHTLMSLSSQNNIAMVLGHQKKYEDAIATYKDVYERKKQFLGPYHSDTIRTLHNIGTVHHESKDFDKALNVFKDVYEIQKRHLGPSHLDTLITQTNIAEILFRQGKAYGAIRNYKQCYNQMKAILGENHKNVVSIQAKMNAIIELSKVKGHDISTIVEDDTILHTAVNNQNLELVKDILSSEFDINTKDCEGRTALHYAANTGNVRILRTLLQNGADVFQVTNKGNTPLHTAVSKEMKEIIEEFLKHVKKHNPRRSRELLDAKTNVGGTTALHICTQKGNHDLAVVLLQNGACYNVKNAQQKSPLQVAKSGSDVQMLLSYIDRLFLTLQLNQKDKVQSLINEKYFEVDNLRKAILYARDSTGKTLLQIATREVAQFMLEKLKSG